MGWDINAPLPLPCPFLACLVQETGAERKETGVTPVQVIQDYTHGFPEMLKYHPILSSVFSTHSPPLPRSTPQAG